MSNPPEQIQIQEPLYAIAVNEPTSVVTVNNETTSVPVVAIDPSDLEKITSNQVEIYKNQEAILNDLTILKDNYKKVSDNQQSILMAIAHISVKFDTIITGKYEPKVTKLNDAMKKTPVNNRFCLKPIRNIEELSNLEAILNDSKMKEDYKIKYSIVCQPGKAENCAYQLVDVFFTREFLTECSWSGSARGEGTKVCLKQYKNVLQLFFELIYECDHTYTIAGNEKFFKSVLKNATKRKNSKLQRSSTCRNSHKRQKLSENPVNNNESSEEGTSKEAQNLVNEANEENRENIPREEKTSQEDNAQIFESVAIEDNVSQDNHVPELPEQQIFFGQENDLRDID